MSNAVAESVPKLNETSHEAENFQSVTIRASLSYNMSNLDLRDRKYSERTIRYLREEKLFPGAAWYYHGFGVASRVGAVDIGNQNNKKVEDFTITGSYFFRPFGAEFSYGRNSRYTISSSPYGVARLWNGMNDGSRMKSETAVLNLFLFLSDFFTLNKNYSYRAAFEQSEKQVKSGGTFFFLLSGDYHQTKSDRPIIPAFAHGLLMFSRLPGLKGWLFGGFAFGVGFAYTLVLPADFCISTYISLAVRPMQKEFYVVSGAKREFRIDSLKGTGKVNAYYNGAAFFAGISAIYDAVLTPCYRFKLEMWSGDLILQFFSGVRI